MLRVRLTGSGTFVDCLQPHPRHQSPDAMTAYDNALPAHIGCDLPAAEERILGEHPVNLFHHRQRIRADPDRRVVERGSAEPHQLALLADTEQRVVPFDRRAFLLGAHRFSLYWSVKFRRCAILVSLQRFGIHLSRLSNFPGPLQITTVILCRAGLAASLRRKQRFDQFPFCVCQIVTINCLGQDCLLKDSLESQLS